MWPIILHITILTDYILLSYLLFLIFNLMIYNVVLNKKVNKGKYSLLLANQLTKHCSNNDQEIVKLSVISFRSSVFLITSISILAIDFDLFPLKHLKRKTFGISLMDLGVGLFIICHSFKLIRNDSQNKNNKKTRQPSIYFKKLLLKLYYTIKTSSLLLVLGFIRLILIKVTNYKISVNEYGTHWNFFFSIFFVKVIIN
jgi:phosphatidylinositol glycan class W